MNEDVFGWRKNLIHRVFYKKTENKNHFSLHHSKNFVLVNNAKEHHKIGHKDAVT
jgi:hypothetical protein